MPGIHLVTASWLSTGETGVTDETDFSIDTLAADVGAVLEEYMKRYEEPRPVILLGHR